MKELRLTAKANKGQVVYDLTAQAGAVAGFLGALDGKRIEVSYREIRDARSLAQNRRYWSLIVPVAAEILSVSRDIPISNDQAHYLLKASFIGVVETKLGMVPKSSKDLTVPEFKAFMDRIEEWFITQYGVVIPARGEEL